MPGFERKPIIIDGSGHLLGRLSSTVAKQLLLGNKVIVVRCEKINMSGNFFRNKLKYLAFLKKRCNVNPARGPFHFRSPSMILWRTIRGMLPHKTERGKKALRRLRPVEGIPPPYQNRRKVVVPSALRALRLKPNRKFCELGRLSHEVGWKYQPVVERLEKKRQIKQKHKVKRIRVLQNLTRQANKKAEKIAAHHVKIIKSYGYA